MGQAHYFCWCMSRYLAEVSYDGTSYHGWQLQNNAITVQKILEDALSTLLRTPTQIVGSGRTDTGVHARQQFFHFDTPQPIDCAQLTYKLNAFLPASIAIHQIRGIQPEAHARFDATLRSYEYHINNTKNPFLSQYSWYFSRPLNVEAMNQAAQVMLTQTDFQAFSKVKTQVNHYLCNISTAQWNHHNDKLIFYVSANRFLRGMVRAIVGTLIEVGLQNLTTNDFKAIIESKDRKKAGRSVPAHGLYLTAVQYPNQIFKHTEAPLK